MAHAQLSVFSPSIKRTMGLQVLLPDGLPAEAMRVAPVLVLLHGWAGNQFDWLVGSDIARFAQNRGLVVVLPSGENHFYLDDDEMEEYYSRWIVDDIPQILAVVFGISWDPKRCYLGGYSMGGYGALRNGLAFPGRFGGLIALSSALITDQVATMTPGSRTPYAGYGYYRRVFGDPATLVGSDRDPEALAARLVAAGTPLPRIFLACGAEDFLVASHRAFHEGLTGLGVDHLSIEAPGGHDFDFWNTFVRQGIDWMFEDQGSWT